MDIPKIAEANRTLLYSTINGEVQNLTKETLFVGFKIRTLHMYLFKQIIILMRHYLEICSMTINSKGILFNDFGDDNQTMIRLHISKAKFTIYECEDDIRILFSIKDMIDVLDRYNENAILTMYMNKNDKEKMYFIDDNSNHKEIVLSKQVKIRIPKLDSMEFPNRITVKSKLHEKNISSMSDFNVIYFTPTDNNIFNVVSTNAKKEIPIKREHIILANICDLCEKFYIFCKKDFPLIFMIKTFFGNMLIFVSPQELGG